MSRRSSFWPIVLQIFVTAHVAMAGDLSTSEIKDGVVRFVVGEFPGEEFHHDSYILPLSRPADIAHARDLIASGPSAGATIVVAKIAKGANGINRDVRASGAPPWSWHVSGFESFADNTIEILDGWPTFVESDVDGWIANTGGHIGFWRYTVVAELPVGDYDADFDVDEEDLAVWQEGFGGTFDLSADGSGDGTVDGADYVLWRENLGTRIQPARPEAGLAVVPEPTILSLVFAGAVIALASRRRLHSLGRERHFSGDDFDGQPKAGFSGADAGLDRAGTGGGRVGDGLGRAR